MRFVDPGCLVSRLLPVAALVLISSRLMADGGAVRLSEEKGNYQVAVFTAPTPLRAGPVDFSALIQNAATHEPVTDVHVTVEAVRRDQPGMVIRRPATVEAATNKLLHAATLNLNEPGWWQLEVCIDGPLGTAEFAFDVEAAKPLPKCLAMWPWLSWPVLVILLFGIHQLLVKRRAD
jgi:hypothetical protein